MVAAYGVHNTVYSEWDFDNYKFIVHELFLYALAVSLKYDRLDQASYLLEQRYYVSENADYGRAVMTAFTVFRNYMRSLEYRNSRLDLRRLALRADLLKERSAGTGIDFRHLLQADFIAFMRAEVEGEERWWPETLLYAQYGNGPFEIFGRSISRDYFDKAKVLLGIGTPGDLAPILKGYQDGSRKLPRWAFDSFDPSSLLGYEHLATRP